MSRTHIMQKVVLGLGIGLASCNLFVGDNPTDTQEDILSLQAVLPALTAAQALGVPADPIVMAAAGYGAQAITQANDPLLPDDPSMMAVGAYDFDDAGGVGNLNHFFYPARDASYDPTDSSYYIQDLFGIGNLGYVMLDTTTGYQVTLTILPALSTAVQSVVEVYDVTQVVGVSPTRRMQTNSIR
jgi:hypothetical protein